MSTKAYQIEPASCSGKALNFEKAEKEIKHGNFNGFYGETKYDGIRYLWQIRPNGAKHNYLTSRRISVTTGEYVEKQDKPAVKFLKDWDKLPADTILDGEIVGGDMSSDTQHEMTTGEVKMKVWDILMIDGNDVRDLTFSQRRKLLKAQKPYLPAGVSIVKLMLPDEALSLAKRKNLEGCIFKDPKAKYGKGWRKVKQEETEDVIIWGYRDTTSEDWKKKGWIGALRIGQWVPISGKGYQQEFVKKMTFGEIPQPGMLRSRKGRTYKFVDMGRCSGFDQRQRAAFSRNPKFFLGAIIEIRFQLRMKKTGKFRSPRFVRIRADKNPWQCVYESKA